MKKPIFVAILLALIGLFLVLYIERPWLRSFTVVVLPDTQKYSESYPEIFCNQTEWIKNNKDNLNIVFVSQLGDIVENGKSKMNEWQTASDCMKIIDGVVPYGIIPGNHDSDIVSDASSGFGAYNETFPVSRFSSYEWYKGNFRENQNNYEIIEVEGMRLLFLNLEIEPSDEVLVWANQVLATYPDMYSIVTTHKYLPDSGTMRDISVVYSKNGNSGEQIWNKLIAKNCGVKMVLSGHYHNIDGENIVVHKNNCGENVYQIVQNYQKEKQGGNGKLRLYTFFPADKRIDVKTYSPYTDNYDTDGDSKFSIPIF